MSLIRPNRQIAPLPFRICSGEIELIKDKSIAREISDLMIEFSDRIDRSILTVQENCSQEEFKAYRLAAAKVLGEVLLEVMNPLYADHPDLKPAGLE
jgi:hypothetical protein